MRFFSAALLLMLFQTAPVAAAGLEFTVQVDRNQITLDESVSLKFSIRTEGNMATGEPQYSAPDFELLNQYSGVFVESFYENGTFGMRNNRTITKVLKPLKNGVLNITGLQVQIGGKTYTAPPIQVAVGAGGAGTPPPKGYGSSGIGLRGTGKKANGQKFFLRAEIDKDKIFKGEQVIVSYFLYRRVKVFNVQVDKFPVLSGFLREDLELPVLGQVLSTDRVILEGMAYERSLLARYAAYPLKDGKLPIDSMSIKSNYYGGAGLSDDTDGADPNDPFMNFFQQMAPRTGTSTSPQITVEVEPLPEVGRPVSFTGGVGDFTVASAVDKYDVHANEPVTLTVKVEGKGNLAAIGEPKGQWPSSVELYDSKGRVNAGRGGTGEKIFEFLLIPRVPGKLTLPSLEFSFFSPTERKYVTRTTEPIDINVGEPVAGGQRYVPAATGQPQGGSQPKSPTVTQDVHDLLAPEQPTVSGFHGKPWWRWLYWLSIFGFCFFGSTVLYDQVQRRRLQSREMAEARAKVESKSWQQLRRRARAAKSGAAWNEVVQSYELLAGAVFDALDRKYRIGSRSFSRQELGHILVEDRGFDSAIWQRISNLLEFAEVVRFAISAGAVSEETARLQLERWVNEGSELDQAITKLA